MTDLSKSPLAGFLRDPGSQHHCNETTDALFTWSEDGYPEGLSDLGRATLAALERPELPEAGEPSVTLFNDTRLAEWWFEYDGPAGKASCVVRVEEFQLASGSWVQRISTSGGTTVPPLLASTLLAAQELAEKWLAERGGK